MNDLEYDIIDELYFVTPFQDIVKALDVADEELCANLKNLIQQGYVKTFYPNPDTDVPFDEQQFQEKYRSFFFLATKAGLIAHNSR